MLETIAEPHDALWRNAGRGRVIWLRLNLRRADASAGLLCGWAAMHERGLHTLLSVVA